MQDRGYGVPRISLPRGRVNEGTKREVWSPQGPRAQWELWWREVADGATMILQNCRRERRRNRTANVWLRSSRLCSAGPTFLALAHDSVPAHGVQGFSPQ